jgi:pimeloyl-ACP methyl ester carboxylesterase
MSMKKTLLIVIMTVSALIISGCASLPELSGLVPADTFIVEESQFIAVNDINIHFTVAGRHTAADDAAEDAAETVPLVLLHGFMANLHSWDYIRPALSERSTVYSYDRIAFGLSERPMPEDFPEKNSSQQSQPEPNPYTAESVRNRAAALMDAWGLEKAVLVGNSAGGSLAVELALAFPERVAALILIDPAVYSNGPPGIVRLLLKLPFLENTGIKNIRRLLGGEDPESLLASAWHDPSRIPPELVTYYSQPLQIENWDRALWEFTKASSNPGITRRLDELTLPILLIHGEQDTIVPVKESRRLAEAIPHAEFHILSQCGHVPQEECPETTAGLIIDFLEKHNL